MRAMVLERASRALVEQKLPVPEPGPTELLVRVRCTGVCRTDLHILDGELPEDPAAFASRLNGLVLRGLSKAEG
jgi:propanol-preferring alcohol dehydrogenase